MSSESLLLHSLPRGLSYDNRLGSTSRVNEYSLNAPYKVDNS